MANVTRRRTGEFLRKLFELLIAAPEGRKAGPLIAEVALASNLTDWEKGEYPSGGQRFEKILRFATVDCVKAGKPQDWTFAAGSNEWRDMIAVAEKMAHR